MSVARNDDGQSVNGIAHRRYPRKAKAASAPHTRLPKRDHHGVGSRAGRCYCACGAKKVKGVCPRCG